MFLDAARFEQVVAATPLVSIDLIIRQPGGHILLGQRSNRPARGYWFVPGGRIRKNETLTQAFCRISEEELGRPFSLGHGCLLGVYEHFYPDCFFGHGDSHPDTHYVVLAYVIDIESGDLLHPPSDQHSQYRWWSPLDLCGSPLVHPNTQAYLPALEAS